MTASETKSARWATTSSAGRRAMIRGTGRHSSPQPVTTAGLWKRSGSGASSPSGDLHDVFGDRRLGAGKDQAAQGLGGVPDGRPARVGDGGQRLSAAAFAVERDGGIEHHETSNALGVGGEK